MAEANAAGRPTLRVVLSVALAALVALVVVALGILALRAVAAELVHVRDPVLASDRSAATPLPSGPVLVLGGNRTRVEVALALDAVRVEGRELIASADAADDLVLLGRDCDEPGIRCVVPDPSSTRGEARLAARLAAEEGWPGLTVVTSRWHLHRTRLHFEACLDIPLAIVAVGPSTLEDPSVPQRRIQWREGLGALDARLRPECRDLAP
jgi:uncharacterized SAM-binding protein YcdF (DUF218 family)